MQFTIPNLLTISRVIAAPLVAGVFLVFDRLDAQWIAFWIFSIAAITDYFDGYLARKWGQVSGFGRMLDPIADKAMVVVAGAVLVGLYDMAGVVLIRQRPGSAKGVVFVTLEDETGVINLVIWPDAMEANRKTIMGARLMSVTGTVQMDEDVIHVVAKKLHDDTARLSELSDDLLKPQMARADHVINPLPSNAGRHPRNVSVIPKSRDFH